MLTNLIFALAFAATPASKPAVVIPVPATPEAFLTLQKNREAVAKQVADLSARLAAMDEALAKADGRAKLNLPGTPLMNGFEVKEADCTDSVQPVEVKATFNPKKPWVLSAEFQSDLPPAGMLLFWGDSRGSRDPLYIRMSAAQIEVFVTDCITGKRMQFTAPLPAHDKEKWNNIEIVLDSGKAQFRVNGASGQSFKAPACPIPDIPMPVTLGGMQNGRDRFVCKLRNVLLTNYEPTR